MGTWSHVLSALSEVHEFERIRNISPNCPILLVSGDNDPVSGYGKTVRELHHRYQLAGVQSELKLYAEGRHEMFNETNREDVYQDCLHWFKKIMKKS